ncbi:GAF and ANTAR domain-containing protein [Sinomonas sp. R1AF57]|uniref:GAF and ANTAR domain-containing protein n=1 Tax=Sinomonas sp. R1AF57 TaxID=2020377 RepID=UPI001ABFEFEF|nr:GAF and ANTAR domain-containing protein [Sinomonas sp. R1AF57]
MDETASGADRRSEPDVGVAAPPQEASAPSNGSATAPTPPENGAVVDGRSAMARAREDELLDLLLDGPDLSTFLTRISQLAAKVLSGIGEVSCSVTVDRDGRRSTMASSDAMAEAMDEVQYASGEGPCQESVSTERTVYVPDLRTTKRYPRYRQAVDGAPLRSVFATPIPLPTSAKATAALNSYSTEPEGFSADLRAEAEELAALASRSVQLAIRFAQESERSADLAAALESRTTINLAAGVIMAQSNCTPAQAIEVLKSASMHRNMKLREVASTVLARFGDANPETHFS